MQKQIFLNFLAHIYLSGENKNIALGNLIGDMVKGKAYENYETNMRTGLVLHRAIDEFTDQHKLFLQSKRLITPDFNRYAGIVLDIYFDHFLARHWEEYCQRDLQEYVNEMYILLIKKYRILPLRAQQITPFMIIRNWLGNYGYEKPLHHIFLGMNRRTQKKGNMDKAIEVLRSNYSPLEENFLLFFDDLKEFSNKKLIELTASPNQSSSS